MLNGAKRMDSVSPSHYPLTTLRAREAGASVGADTWSQSTEAVVQKNDGNYCTYERAVVHRV